MFVIANDIAAGATVRPVNNSIPDEDLPAFSISTLPPPPKGPAPLPWIKVTDVHQSDEGQPMSATLLVNGAWQVWPKEALFEVKA